MKGKTDMQLEKGKTLQRKERGGGEECVEG